MRLFPLLLQKAFPVLLVGTGWLCTALILPVFADMPPPAVPPSQTQSQSRFKIQCTAVRARSQDFDDLGINCILIPSERPSFAGLAQTPPRFAAVTLGLDAKRALRSLTQQPTSVVRTLTLTTADGQPATFSLPGLKDLGVSQGSRLSVTAQRHADGVVTLSIEPHLTFVILPAPGNSAAPVSVEAFPLRRTLAYGNFLAFTLYPKPKPGLHFSETLPIISAPSDSRHEDRNETQLWIFLSATLLPN